jgi:hypothetical protein
LKQTTHAATKIKAMLKPDFLNEFMEQAGQILPGAKTRDEIQKSLQVIAQSTLAKLDLVTRDEFDSQTEVLRRTRLKIDELEQRLKELSAQLDK